MKIRFFNDFFPAELTAFVSDRSMDFTLKEGQSGLTGQQKQFLSSQLNFDLPQMVNIRQVHGSRIIVAAEETAAESSFPEEADGAVTNVCCLALTVRTADCLPIFIFDPRRKCIGLIHAGWRGARQEIPSRAVRLLEKRFGCRPQDIRVAFGPAIRPCCYAVGEEFKDYFPDETMERGEKRYFDLPKASRNQLLRCGIKEANIFDCGICTCCDTDYFSYRREGERTGRMISLMMLRS